MSSSLMRRLLAGAVPSALVAGLLGVTSLSTAAKPAVAADQNDRDFVSLVDPWVEADRGRFFFFQSASDPFGFVKLRPDTSTNDGYSAGYRRNEDQVKGFSHLHDWQISGVQVMPTTGSGVVKTQGDTGWQSHVEHDDSEVVEPGYHRLHLDRYGITAELTATDRVGLHRYTYDNAGPSEILINLGGRLGEATMRDAQVTKVSNTELAGFVNQNGYTGQNNRLFFNIRFDKPFASLRGWSNGQLAQGGAPLSALAGDNMGVYARYDHLRAGESVQMKVGLSFTGIEGARKNLQTEAPGWDFDAVRQASRDRWNQMLGRIDVAGGTSQQQVKFYTDMFHVLSGRSTISDVDGKYLDNTWGNNKVKQIPRDKHGKPKFAMYNYDALWLTQWNLNSVLGMAYPEVYSSFVQSQLQMYQDGGLLPRGPSAGNYTGVMTSSPVTSFITGAYNKGIRDFDTNLAFDAMLDAQSPGGLYELGAFEYGSWGGCGGAKQYLQKGYVPEELCVDFHNGGAGLTLEYSYQDWALANLAKQLHKKGLNIAQAANVEVSSQANDSSAAGVRAVDGRPIRSSHANDSAAAVARARPGAAAPRSTDPKAATPPSPDRSPVRLVGTNEVEWQSAGQQKPWIKLSWDKPRLVSKVVLSDRADRSANVNAGILRFSDGSSVKVANIATDGSNRVVEFPPREVSWVKFEATASEGTNVGLNEIEVWDDTDLGEYLQNRSGNWRNVFDPETDFIRPKHADGTWMKSFDPLASTDFVEANSWQATWFTSHDVMGLANLMGGRKAYADKLNYAFEKSADSNFISDYGNGYVSYGNQPALQNAHLFNYVGYPWLSQYWVRQVKEKVYGSTSTTDGYGHHDEDQGQMGSISALMAIGLFEVTGGGLDDPVYDITSPVFDEITIKLNQDYYSGKQFRIVTHNNSANNMYIQGAKLDGARLDNAWFRHDQLTDGGTLELWMGDTPNKNWGVNKLPPSESKETKQTLATSIDIVAPDVIKEPYSSVQLEANFTPENTSYQRADWSVTEPDGSPTDKATIDYSGALTVNDREGDIRITARAADEGGATTSKTVTVDLDPTLLRGNAARWPHVTATASSEYSANYAAEKVFDGIIKSKDTGDWASRGERNPWIQLNWQQPISADKIVLYDRPDLDDANGGTLTFSDGSSVTVSDVAPDGSATTVRFPMRTFEWVKFQVQGGTGFNPGLSELEVYAVPSPPDAPRQASAQAGAGEATVSWQPPGFDGGAPVTGYIVTTWHDGTKMGTKTVDRDMLQTVVSGLEPGTDYRFTVAATNLKGVGSESAPTETVIPQMRTSLAAPSATHQTRHQANGW